MWVAAQLFKVFTAFLFVPVNSPDISPGQRRWLSAPAVGLCLGRSLQPNTSRARAIRGTGPPT